jgi:multidrug efflux pump subunit AcrB
VALTVVPVMGSLFIKPGDSADRGDSWLQRVYTPLVRWALGHKLTTLAISVALFAGSFGLLRAIPVSFLPTLGGDILTLDLSLPRGAGMESLLSEVVLVEDLLGGLRSDGAVVTFHADVGSGGFFGQGGGGFGSSNSASFFILLSEEADRDVTADLLRRELAGGERTVIVAEAQGGGPQSDLLELTLMGEDYPVVAEAAEELVAALRGVAGLENVGSDAAPEGAADRISRVNGKRAVTISGSITDENTQRVDRQVSGIVEDLGLPPGVELVTGGVFESIREAFTQMGKAMLAGIVLVYVVMVVSMRSLRTPFVIILSLPLASIGALGALFLTQRALGLPALIGLLMLIGLVVTNAIVLIGFVEQLRARGLGMYEALIEGCRTRLRPILMTAFTTSFALVPLAVSVSGGGIVSSELATVVIGGLMTSTFLTLLVIPVVYSLIRRGREPRTVAASGEDFGGIGRSDP